MRLLFFFILLGSSVVAHAKIDLLSLQELRELDHNARVYYIQTYRMMMKDLEPFQKKFGMKLAQETSTQQKLWSLIFATAEAGQIFSRGESSLDKCIWAGNIQDYSGVGRCTPPACTDGSGGVRCSLLGTGISECVPASVSMNSTSACSAKAQQCASSAQSSGASQQVLANPNASVADLVRLSCDPQVMSALIKKVETNGLEGLPANVKAEFEFYDVKRSGVNSFVAALQNHCTSTLSSAAINGLSPENRSRAQQILAKGGTPTVEEFVQPSECAQLNLNVSRIEQRFTTVAAQVPSRVVAAQTPPPKAAADSRSASGAPVELYPATGRGVPGTLTADTTPRPAATSVTVQATPPPPQQTAPAASTVMVPTGPVGPVQNNRGGNGSAEAISTSCVRMEDEDRRLITDRGMSCVACLVDSMGGKSLSSYATAGVSSKWLALLATVGQICGKPLSAEDSLYFVQALGHCSNMDYYFRGDMSNSDKNLVREWQQGRLKNEMDRADNQACAREGLKQGCPSNFARIYGVSRDAAQDILCPKMNENYGDRYGNDRMSLWVQRAQSMTGLDFNKARGDTVANQVYEKDFVNPNTNPNAASLHKCIAEAEKNRTQFNLAQAGRQCNLSEETTLGSAQHAVQKMQSENLPVMGINRTNPKDCWISLAASKYKDGRQMVTLVNPRAPTDRVYYDSTSGSNPVRGMTAMTMASAQNCTQGSRMDGNYLNPIGAKQKTDPEKGFHKPVHFGN